MTTQTTTQGRPLSEKGRKARNAVLNYVNKTEGEFFTVADVRKATKQNKVYVRNRLIALENEGVIHKVGTQAQSGRGRPMAVYEKSETVNHEDSNKKEYRAKLRELAAMNYEQRMEVVGQALVELYNRQVEDERETKHSYYLNSHGFTKYDAKRGTEDAQDYMESGRLTTEQVNYWLNPVSSKGRTRIGKYHRQVNI